MVNMKINIEYNSEINGFFLKGDIAELFQKDYLRLYLKSNLNAELQGDKIVIINGLRKKEETIKLIEKLFEKYKINSENSYETNEVIKEYNLEKERFKIFSDKAKTIRNNHCDLKDFKKFKEVVKVNLKNRKLTKLQLLSAYHLAFAQNACNFSVPGSGKTSIVYGAYSYLKNIEDNLKKVDKILVIGPLSSFYPWESEYLECFGVKPSVKRIHSQNGKLEKMTYFYSRNPEEITLISYQGVLSLKEDIKNFLQKNKVMVVLDEAHRIKNIDEGIIAESILELAKFSSSRVVLTGTPLPQGYQDLFNLYKFIWPEKDIINFNKFQLKEMSKNKGDSRIKNLIENVSPFFLRIKKKDLSLPNALVNPPVYVEMGKYQRSIYEHIREKIFENINSKKDRDFFKSKLQKAKLIRLMQTAINPGLLRKPLDKYYAEGGIDANFMNSSKMLNLIRDYEISNETPPKFQKALELINIILKKNEKVVVWATFIQNIKSFHEYLNKNGIKSKIIYGETPLEKDIPEDDIDTREKIIKQFHDDATLTVLIANPFAVSESISLHKACNHSIYLERSFNAAQFIQSKDRIHRFGMKKHPNYYYILSKESIDERIHHSLQEKEERMNKIVESEEIPLFFNAYDSEFSDADIKGVLEEYAK